MPWPDRARPVAALAVVALASGGRPAAWARPEVVGAAPPLVAFHAARPSALAASARAALGRAAEQRGAALVDLSPSPSPPAEAPRQLARAIEAYHGFAYRDAQLAADAGLREAGGGGGRGLDPRQLGELFLYRGLAASELGDAGGAWEDFVRAATIDPARTLDPARFPPRVIESFQRALAEVARLPRLHATIVAPASCSVRVDGRVLVEVVLAAPRGEHVVGVDCPGWVAWGATVVLASEGQVIRPRLIEERPPRPAALVASARARGLGGAVLARVAAGPGGALLLGLERFDGRGRLVGQVAAALHPGDVDRAATAALDRLLAPGPLAAGSGPGSPWYANARIWFGAAAGAALATAVLLPFALDRGGERTGFAVDLGTLP